MEHPGSDDGSEETEGANADRLGLAAIAAWFLFAGVCFALDGAVGIAVAVVVAAVVLARLPRRWLGALGLAALVAAPASVLLDGLPSPAEVSPGFVTRSLLPHHLTFAGFALVSAWVVLDLAEHLRVTARDALLHDDDVAVPDGQRPQEVGSDVEPLGHVGWPVRLALLAVVGAVALAGAVAVVVQ